MAEGQAAAQAIGSIVQGVAGYEAGRQSKRAAYQSAIEAEQDSVDEAARIRERARKEIGGQLAAQASNGFQIGTGSALDALAESQTNAVLDAMIVGKRAASEARSRRKQGDMAFDKGKFDLITGILGAGASVASAKADWADARAGQSASSGSYGGGSAASGIIVRPGTLSSGARYGS